MVPEKILKVIFDIRTVFSIKTLNSRKGHEFIFSVNEGVSLNDFFKRPLNFESKSYRGTYSL